jgi:hypothetical protein
MMYPDGVGTRREKTREREREGSMQHTHTPLHHPRRVRYAAGMHRINPTFMNIFNGASSREWWMVRRCTANRTLPCDAAAEGSNV